MLTELLETDRLVDKLLGMQLIVESVAVTLFRSVAQAGVEPVLSELMPYFERDEARHVGLGVLYLPKLLAKLGPLEAARLKMKQLKIVTLIGWGTHLKKRHFETLGIDNNDGFRRGTRLQPRGARWACARPAATIRAASSSAIRASTSSTTGPSISSSRAWAPSMPAWQRTVINFVDELSRVGDRALRLAA